MTWIEKDGTQFPRSGRGVLDHRKTCRSSGAIIIVHWNLEESALEIVIRGINSKVLATTPRNLQGDNEGLRNDGAHR